MRVKDFTSVSCWPANASGTELTAVAGSAAALAASAAASSAATWRGSMTSTSSTSSASCGMSPALHVRTYHARLLPGKVRSNARRGRRDELRFGLLRVEMQGWVTANVRCA